MGVISTVLITPMNTPCMSLPNLHSDWPITFKAHFNKRALSCCSTSKHRIELTTMWLLIQFYGSKHTSVTVHHTNDYYNIIMVTVIILLLW